jgi:ACT domain-containing protein
MSNFTSNVVTNLLHSQVQEEEDSDQEPPVQLQEDADKKEQMKEMIEKIKQKCLF